MMKRNGPVIGSVEDRRKLCLWMLDRVRQNLPPEYKELIQPIYAIEHKISEDRPTDFYSNEELVQFRFMGPDAHWLHEGIFSMPHYGKTGVPAFESMSLAVLPSYSQNAVRITVECEGRLPSL